MIRWLQQRRYRQLAQRGFLVFKLGDTWYVRDPIPILFRLNQDEVAQLLQEVQASSELGQYDAGKLDRAYRVIAEIFEVPLGPQGASYQEINELMLIFQEWCETQKKSSNP